MGTFFCGGTQDRGGFAWFVVETAGSGAVKFAGFCEVIAPDDV
jgi:hypothetical protein